ncbi:uncharacterized protein LOC122528820 isoform X2 [Frieseomelitta varia]|uniref:uncharacterized protein LOC122528820 isoform X2 n=1 Tax=Frieseomelitta varia TaxID=561572 RepID=UPI001CB6B2BE|nr:uncharacterized protein LOC122528820 isoform X2 [Frieseomelitta varia]
MPGAVCRWERICVALDGGVSKKYLACMPHEQDISVFIYRNARNNVIYGADLINARYGEECTPSSERIFQLQRAIRERTTVEQIRRGVILGRGVLAHT